MDGWGRGRQNVRFVLAILCLVLLFGLNVTRDGIELSRVKVQNYVQRFVYELLFKLTIFLFFRRCEIYKLEF